jgi:pimeloyl-ACP methyl ester carboxylesterase
VKWWAPGAVLAATACSAGSGVHTERAVEVTVRTLSPSTLDWSSCPDLADDLSAEWECAWVDAPLDHADPSGDTISVALSRPVLDDSDTRRPLVVNPGGPGGSGIELAWYLIDLLPAELLDDYYPVGWDPRGVGRSLPAVDCGDFDRFAIPDVQTCIDNTGSLLAQVGAADAALDLDQVRAALGVERLDYLGYSYGTALGAIYAMAHPDGVGRFVLDGATDPTAGDPDGPLALDGVPDYAADETDAVIARFHELCDASAVCAAGPHSELLLDQLEVTIRDLPTAEFSGEPAHMERIDLEELMVGAMFDPWSWGLIGDALRDGADGDASTLAALSSYLLNGYPAPPPGEEPVREFGGAHFAIYCADFGHIEGAWECDGMPDADRLPSIEAVDVAEPIVVVGTAFDPATPGRHAAEFAAALEDAVAISWEGVGHTAFPVDPCLDDLVVGHLVDGVVPDDGETCPFVEGITTDAELGDYLFDYPPDWVEGMIEDVLVAEGTGESVAACRAGELSDDDHRAVTHILLGVESDAAETGRRQASDAC